MRLNKVEWATKGIPTSYSLQIQLPQATPTQARLKQRQLELEGQDKQEQMGMRYNLGQLNRLAGLFLLSKPSDGRLKQIAAPILASSDVYLAVVPSLSLTRAILRSKFRPLNSVIVQRAHRSPD